VEESPGSVDQLMLIVATGSAVGILPQATDRIKHHGVEIRPLPGFIPAAQVALITRDGPTSRPLQALLALLQRPPFSAEADGPPWPAMIVAAAEVDEAGSRLGAQRASGADGRLTEPRVLGAVLGES
jgi:hypothetical protein